MKERGRLCVPAGPGPCARGGRPLLGFLPSSFLVALWLGSASPLSGLQAVARPDSGSDTLTAAEALSRARSAQRRFELARRRWLPVTRSWSGSSCDEIVGRMCQNHDEGGDWWPEPEDRRIGILRDTLLAELEAAARADPGDSWIVGQRVAYLGESGAWEAAEGAARECLATHPGWCGSLLGLALHGQGRYPEAEAVFRATLPSLDERERVRWLEPSEALDGRARDWLAEAREAGDEARDRAIAVLWRLADPLYLVQGNDRLTEHWSRRTLARVRERARNPHGLSWGSDLEELLVRYGWEIGWERTASAPGLAESVVGHQHPESRSYLPPGWVIEDPARVEAGRWGVHDRGPRSAYAPPYAPVIIPAQGEVLVFPHPGGARLVASYALPEDTTRHAAHDHPPFEPPASVQERATRAGLFLVPLEGTDAVPPALSDGREGVLLLEAPGGEHLVSLEVWSPERGLAGRLRHGLVVAPSPPDVPTLSDLALLDSLLAPGATLEEALAHLRPAEPVRPGERIVVGWEVQGLGWRASEPLSYRLTLTREDRGLLGRIAGWLGFGSDAPSRALSWQEQAPERPGLVFRTVALDVPEVEPGVYRLRLELATGGRSTLVAERHLPVRP